MPTQIVITFIIKLQPQAEGQKQRWEIKQIAWQASMRSFPLLFEKDDR
jgi:hypothetical protein